MSMSNYMRPEKRKRRHNQGMVKEIYKSILGYKNAVVELRNLPDNYEVIFRNKLFNIVNRMYKL